MRFAGYRAPRKVANDWGFPATGQIFFYGLIQYDDTPLSGYGANAVQPLENQSMKTLRNLFLFAAALPLTQLALSAEAQTRLSDYIRPFVGTKGGGNTYPGPSAPFGMIQISPDTDITNWDTDSGYDYKDPTIHGFSLTHLSGTGCPDLGDFLFVPQVGKPEFIPGSKDHPESGYQSAFSHDDESASAGFYRVKLQKSGVTAELTAGERAGMLRFTFPASDEASILTDLNHVINGGRWRVAESHLRVEEIPRSPVFTWSTVGPRSGIFISPRDTRVRSSRRKSSATASR